MENQSGKEFTYVMIKPVSENNKENVISQKIILKEINKRFKEKNLFVAVSGKIQYTPETIARHYQEHVGKSFYPSLQQCLLKNSAFGMVVCDENGSENVIDTVRSMAGSTIKINKETGEIRLPEPGSLRYNLFITLYQVKNGTELKDVVIPENLDDCKKVYNEKNNCVDIFKENKKIAEMFMTENLVHTSSCKSDAKNEVGVFYDLLTKSYKKDNEQEF